MMGMCNETGKKLFFVTSTTHAVWLIMQQAAVFILYVCTREGTRSIIGSVITFRFADFI